MSAEDPSILPAIVSSTGTAATKAKTQNATKRVYNKIN